MAELTDLERLKAAFKELRSKGYIALANVPSCALGCCPTWSDDAQERWDQSKQKVMFTRKRGPFLKGEVNIPAGEVLHLHWEGDFTEIVRVLEKHGLPCWSQAFKPGEDPKTVSDKTIEVYSHVNDFMDGFKAAPYFHPERSDKKTRNEYVQINGRYYRRKFDAEKLWYLWREGPQPKPRRLAS